MHGFPRLMGISVLGGNVSMLIHLLLWVLGVSAGHLVGVKRPRATHFGPLLTDRTTWTMVGPYGYLGGGMTVQMNVAEAKAKLSELLAAVDAGEEVIIARGGVPAARLVPVARTGVRLGILEGVVDAASVPDFLEPMSPEDLAEWEA